MRQHLWPLTAMRFFLAGWVVIFHQLAPAGMLGLPAQPGALNVLRHGYVAVTSFFVLSGYVLAHAHEGEVLPGPFWRRRIARLYPVYVAGLLISVPIVLWQIRIGTLELQSSMLSLALSLAMLQSWAVHVPFIWNGPGWSLSVEFAFYAAFPFIQRGLPRSRQLLMLGLVTSVATSVALNLAANTFGSLAWLDTFPPARVPDFVAGICLQRLEPFTGLVRGLGLAMGLLGFSLLSFLPPEVAAWGFATPFAVGLVTALAVPAPMPSMLVLLGESSYAAYILHLPLATWFGRAWKLLGGTFPSPWCFLTYFIVVSVASVLVYRGIEVPMRRWLTSRAAEGVAT